MLTFNCFFFNIPLAIGQLIKQPSLANTLEVIANNGVEGKFITMLYFKNVKD